MKCLLRTCVHVLLLSSLSCAQAKCPLRDWLPNWSSKKNIALQQKANEVRRSGRQLHPALAAAIEKGDRRLVSSEVQKNGRRSPEQVDAGVQYAKEQWDSLRADYARLIARKEDVSKRHWLVGASLTAAVTVALLVKHVLPEKVVKDANVWVKKIIDPSVNDQKAILAAFAAAYGAYTQVIDKEPSDDELEKLAQEVNNAEKVLHDLKDQKDNIS